MSHSYPGSELSVEQLVHALARFLNPNYPLRREFLDLGPQKIHGIERDLSEISRAIRTIQNTFVPVNKLPPEILSRVLEHRACERGLIGATHVCQHWRSVLISSPSLWSCFQIEYGSSLDRILMYLERSKSAPIDVSITNTDPKELVELKPIVPHIARTRSLILHELHPTSHPASPLFCNPIPSLQHLEIHIWGDKFVCLPENFLGQQASSLRSVDFEGIRPTLETFFPLPNLTEFRLHLPDGAGPFRMGALFRFLSDSPLLEKLSISIPSQTTHDIPTDQVISLGSLVELEYTYNSGDRVLPCLKLPRLKQLQVFSSLRPGEVQKPANILPYDVRAFLAGATKMSYHSTERSTTVRLSGGEVSASVATTTGDLSIDWFFDQTCIPFGKIEILHVSGYRIAGPLPLYVFALENLRVLRVFELDVQFVDVIFRSLHPDPAVGVPCRPLREIECVYWKSEESSPRSLISLVRERKQAGYQLRLVTLTLEREPNQDFIEELREHVEEVQVREFYTCGKLGLLN